MPYKFEPTSPSHFHIMELWPHSSLPIKGFAWTIWMTFILISVPLFMTLGTILFWGLLPFLMLTVAALYWAITRNYKDRSIRETLIQENDTWTLKRVNPKGDTQTWACNSYWIKANIYSNGGPVKNYITLSGNGREVEIGAFLTEEERLTLFQEISEALSAAKLKAT